MISITQNDHHNDPRDLEFKTLKEGVKYILHFDPMGDTFEDILEDLSEAKEYWGCDQWTLNS